MPRFDEPREGVAPLPPIDVERNRELIAERLGWPEGAVEVCREVEARWPDWRVHYDNGRVPGGPGPGYVASLEQSQVWRGYRPKVSAAHPEELETLIRDADAQRPPRPW
jgi:hypothetical protein